MITVTKTNEVYLRVDTDLSTSQEINDFFTFDVPGAKFMPLYKSRMWDGKARLFNMYKKELYVGLLPYLQEFAKKLEYKIEVNMDEIGVSVSYQYVEDFTNNLNFKSNGADITAHDYQLSAVQHAIEKGRTLLLSPTASGKSLIIYSLIRYHQHLGRKQLIIVPTTSLVEQMYGDFQDYASASDWSVADNCHRIYGGKEKSNESPVTISTWQSIYKFPKTWFDTFEVVYGDECLHPNTQITMADGNEKEIQNIAIGDRVRTFNENTHEYEDKLVLKVHHNISKNTQMFEVLLNDGKLVKITGNHKVLLTNGKWKRVDALQIGDVINSII